ncbi:hypothetical protein GCM10018782_24350 [Streptomyces griseoaurantiacus]|nr:hypothetical protein [Streptomyces sp. MH191]GHE48859.1 hypothetical protein GCM10018782_24350 [Streptomyces griseoaurantiacus]
MPTASQKSTTAVTRATGLRNTPPHPRLPTGYPEYVRDTRKRYSRVKAGTRGAAEAKNHWAISRDSTKKHDRPQHGRTETSTTPEG